MSKLSLLLALAVLPFAALAAKLEEPAPIQVPPGVSPAAVLQAIKIGGSRREWQVVETGPGQLEATLQLRQHMVKVAISYGPQDIRIHYLDSAVMDYEMDDGVAQIHSKYMNWTRNLAHDIRQALLQAPNGG